MNVFTGNFANVTKYRKKNIYCISISRSSKYFNGYRLSSLVPEYGFSKLSKKDYEIQYYHKLENLNADHIFKHIEEVSKGRDVVLLCHEKAGSFCHRKLVANWLEKELGIEVKELGRMESIEKGRQGKLFV